MSIEYVFWVKLIKRSAYFFNFFWNIPKKLIKVIVTKSQIRSDGPIGSDSQDILSIDLPNIAQVTWSVTSPGSIGFIKIVTQDSKCYYLTPVNPLDPTLLLTYDNIDELITFCDIVNALKTDQIPNYDENPYIRQIQKKGKPAYLNNKNDIHWDKNVSPLEYYHEFMPVSEEKKRRLLVMIFKFFISGVLIIVFFGFLYALYTNFKW